MVAPSPANAPSSGTRLDQLERQERRRTALVTMLVLALIVAATWEVRRAWKRSIDHWRASAKLRGLGAHVEWTWEGRPWMSEGFTTVTFPYSATIFSHPIRDADLEPLRRLAHVRSLDISRCEAVTDAGLKVIAGLNELQELHVSGGPNRDFRDRSGMITDTGLQALSGLTRLKILTLANCNITDAGLAHLQGLKNLEDLDLTATHVTDAGLSVLKGLPKLEQVMLEGTEVTVPALQALRQARPKMAIHHERLGALEGQSEGEPEGMGVDGEP